MKFGFILPSGDARTAAGVAREAELAGWDGFFVWEPVWGIDAWNTLTAAAMVTESIRLGTMLTPLSRMRPWELASKTVTLDHLSDGRVTLAVGLGAVDSGFAQFGEQTDIRTRAELMDEGLDILTGLWKGQPLQIQIPRGAVMLAETQKSVVLIQEGRAGPIVGAAWAGLW